MRIDVFMVETALSESRTRASELIRSGLVTLNGRQVTKPSTEVGEGDNVLVSEMEHHSNIVPWQLVAERKGAEQGDPELFKHYSR